MAHRNREHRGEDPWTYYGRNQEYYGPDHEGGYDPERDRFVRTPEWEEGQYPEDSPHKTYFRSTFQTNPFGSAEQTGPAHELRPGPHTGRGPKGYQKSDERILEQVCERLADHPGIDARDICVEVNQGVVILSGCVHSRATKWLAEDIVESVPGIRDIENRLEVGRRYWPDDVQMA